MRLSQWEKLVEDFGISMYIHEQNLYQCVNRQTREGVRPENPKEDWGYS